MLKTLTLKNFRKHEDLEINFGKGLVVIRGANEVGKTTLGESILYVLFGASMLRESLDMAVTYDKPESSLKACLTFELDGVDYKIVRGKSGAELAYSDQLVTGQKETRLFVERLLGCTAATAKLLMFADQNSVQGVLAEGGTAANGLVETLAQLGLIENLVGRIQEQLPSGNTKALEAQIESLKSMVIEVPDAPSDSEVVQALRTLANIELEAKQVEESMPAESAVVAAWGQVRARDAAAREVARLEARKAQIEATLASTSVVEPFPYTTLVQARQDVANLPEQQRRWKAFTTIFPTCSASWDGDFESAVAFEKETAKQVQALCDKVSDLSKQVEITLLKKINEKSCAFCKKDLTDVPEVTVINEAADAKIMSLQESAARFQTELGIAKKNLETIQQVLSTTARCQNLAGDYWKLQGMPPTVSWIGEPPTEPGTTNLPKLEQQWCDFEKLKTQREALKTELAEMLWPEVSDISESENLIDIYEAAKLEHQELKLKEMQVQGQVNTAKQRFDAAVAARESLIQRNSDNTKAVAQLVSTRDETLKHNDLIKKLRAARPEIASKMWGTVLGAVSRYFSQIRGEASTVTRTADGFKVNGRSVAGLSGSTNDALGLAIRMALSKLFLPNVPFLFLDESFSGADNTRELAGVATLAGAGFSQILLVTHSELPEQIADTLVVL